MFIPEGNGMVSVGDKAPDFKLRADDGAAYILNDLGVKSIVLLTNNPDKVVQLKTLGVKVTGREPLRVKGNRVNSRYLSTKKRKMGHILDDA